MLKRLWTITTASILLLGSSLPLSVANAGLIVEPTLNGSAYESVRGYWFQTQEDMTFESVWLSNSLGVSQDYDLQILSFDAAPPEYPSTTSDFTQLGLFESQSSKIDTTLHVMAGTVLGFLAFDHVQNSISYSSDRFHTIGNFDIEFTRLVRQSFDFDYQVTSEADVLNIGAIGFEYNIGQFAASVPEPSSLAIFALGLVGLSAASRKKLTVNK